MRKLLLYSGLFVLLISVASILKDLTSLYRYRDVYFYPEKFNKEYVLIDSVQSFRGRNSTTSSHFGYSKTFDNYQTVIDMNNPMGEALISNYIPIESEEAHIDTLDSYATYYYMWHHPEDKIGYICNKEENSIHDNWLFLDLILSIKVTIGTILYCLFVYLFLRYS